jgi:phage baseplate assembly protein W
MPNFYYTGFSSVGVRGTNTSIQDLELVKQDLLNHFFITRGEVPGRIDFGSDITLLMSEPFDDLTKDKIEEEVRRVILSDPRVEVVGFTTEADIENHSIYVRVELNFVEIGLTDFLELNLTETGIA